MQKFIKDEQYQQVMIQMAESIDWGIKNSKILDFINNNNLSGKGIKIAIVDTGILPHQDVEVKISYDFYADYRSHQPFAPHGLFVAGVCAAKKNNFGILGIAPDAEVFDIRVLNSSGMGSWKAIGDGLQKALDLEPDIINLSLGCHGKPPKRIERLINQLLSKGIIIVAAAGNEGQNILDYPAAYEGVIAVGAINCEEEVCDFSNYSQLIHIFAPGEHILSCLPEDNYGTGNGTSYASPFIAGLIALILEQKGKLTVNEVLEELKYFCNDKKYIDIEV